ncbi:MAG: hypothetical protein VX866_06120 [Pseudomonadota bacterium]|nr:hypothetical protein [Pseudomonadota bacterium]MEC7452093.1 hypothetical protein [Pseudomonadota bacterium]
MAKVPSSRFVAVIPLCRDYTFAVHTAHLFSMPELAQPDWK